MLAEVDGAVRSVCKSGERCSRSPRVRLAAAAIVADCPRQQFPVGTVVTNLSLTTAPCGWNLLTCADRLTCCLPPGLCSSISLLPAEQTTLNKRATIASNYFRQWWRQRVEQDCCTAKLQLALAESSSKKCCCCCCSHLSLLWTSSAPICSLLNFCSRLVSFSLSHFSLIVSVFFFLGR